MNDAGKRRVFRLVRIVLITTLLMSALVVLHPDRYLPAEFLPDSQPEAGFSGLQVGALLALMLAALGLRVWLGRVRRKRGGQ